MARIRTIKPEFFKNEQLAELDPIYRLLFIGLWNHADREGRLEDRPKRIKAEILPYDECDVDFALIQLHESDFIKRYVGFIEDIEIKCIQILNFTKHQKIDKFNEKESQLPEYQTVNSIDYKKTFDSTLIAGEGKGRERKGKEGKGGAEFGQQPTDQPKTNPSSQPPPPPAPPQVIHPFTSDTYLKLWVNWKEYRKTEHGKKYKSAQSEQAAINHLAKLSFGIESDAQEIIMQSMAQGWQGLFELKKTNNNGNGNNNNGANEGNKQAILNAFKVPSGTF